MWKKIAVLSFAVAALSAVGAWRYFEEVRWDAYNRNRNERMAEQARLMANDMMAPKGAFSAPEWPSGAAKIAEGIAHQGPNYPTAARYIGKESDLTWLNPQNVFAEDGACATNGGGSRSSICPIITGGYGFSIPDDAEILGVVVEYKLHSVGGTAIDGASMLAIDDGPTGKNFFFEFRLPLEPAWIVYGTPEEKWRHDWTPEEINSPGFGSIFRFDVLGMVDSVMLDAARITVYYKPPEAPPSSE
jgi:hypothetical protein